MPPAPAGATTSYGPSFVPQESPIRGRNYSLSSACTRSDDFGRLVGQPEGILLKLPLMGLSPHISTLRLLSWPQQNFTHERLRSLRHQHGHRVRHVIRLEHLVGIFACVRTKLGVYRAGADNRHSDIVRTELLGHRIR